MTPFSPQNLSAYGMFGKQANNELNHRGLPCTTKIHEFPVIIHKLIHHEANILNLVQRFLQSIIKLFYPESAWGFRLSIITVFY